MTPKEKAEELIEKFAPIMPNEDWKVKAKQCALIALNKEIADFMWLNVLCMFDNYMKEHITNKIVELEAVKSEIELL